MTDTHKVIEIVFTEVCKEYDVDWKVAYNMDMRKIGSDTRRARALMFYILVKKTSIDAVLELCNIQPQTLNRYIKSVSETIKHDTIMQGISDNITAILYIRKIKPNDIIFKPNKHNMPKLLNYLKLNDSPVAN